MYQLTEFSKILTSYLKERRKWLEANYLLQLQKLIKAPLFPETASFLMTLYQCIIASSTICVSIGKTKMVLVVIVTMTVTLKSVTLGIILVSTASSEELLDSGSDLFPEVQMDREDRQMI